MNTGAEDDRLAAYASDLEPSLVQTLDTLADRFKPAGPACVVRIELHYDTVTGRFVSAYTTLKTTRKMLG